MKYITKIMVALIIAITIIILLYTSLIFNDISYISAILGGLTGLGGTFIALYSKISDTKLKEKELSQQITQQKQQELYSKEIEIYQELYLLSIKYTQLKHDLDIDTFRGNHPTTHHIECTIYSDFIENKIFPFIENNIFYLSVELDSLYQKLFDAYSKNMKNYNNLKESLSGEDTNNPDNQSNLDNEKVKGQKVFYKENKVLISKFWDLVKKEFKDKRAYK